MSPFLRTSYYGQKRATRGLRHFVSSTIEYTADFILGLASCKIPFYSLLLSPDKPSKRNKTQDPIKADILCDTGASISLAPISIAQSLKMKIDRSHLNLVWVADGKKISIVGTNFVYMKDSASPLWSRVKVVVTHTGDNILLSNAELKNLDLLPTKFPT